MLDHKPGTHQKEPFDSTTRLRHGSRFADLINRASVSLGIDKSGFIRAAAEREAERVLAAQSEHVLTVEDAKAFGAALDAEPAPKPRALKAAQDYRARVVHAD